MAATINATCAARVVFDVFMCSFLECPGFAAASGMRHRAPGAARLNVRQARFRGGWSGGGRLNPSAKTPPPSAGVGRTAWRPGRADVAGGAAWAVVNAHMAMIGQSVHVLLFCSSGQHGISAAIDDMSATDEMSAISGISVIPAAIWACIAAGAATGATASPTTMAIASNRVMNRRKTMPYTRTAVGAVGRGAASLSRQAADGIKRAGCGSLHRSGDDFSDEVASAIPGRCE